MKETFLRWILTLVELEACEKERLVYSGNLTDMDTSKEDEHVVLPKLNKQTKIVSLIN